MLIPIVDGIKNALTLFILFVRKYAYTLIIIIIHFSDLYKLLDQIYTEL